MTHHPLAKNPSPDSPAVALELGFEDTAHAFWQKNRGLILLACIAALLVIIGREGWQYYSAQQELRIQSDYARTADRPEQLNTFASANSSHPLAGVAYLRMADISYLAADYTQAAINYNKALIGLKNSALRSRARLGAAMSLINTGDKSAGEAALKSISADLALLTSTRAEAGYHLATLAFEAGNATEVNRLVAEIGKLDPTGQWSQRATALLTIKAK